mmetsp:Transcript_16966/g.48194  ORF Transcript_16966/g.48194 Transcript_16966/m.48194 type:complete len:304 (+) Transcript_16966:237-1148(+)
MPGLEREGGVLSARQPVRVPLAHHPLQGLLGGFHLLGGSRLHELLFLHRVVGEQELHSSSNCGANEWPHPHDPEVPQAALGEVPAVPPHLRDEGRAERADRVDGAAVDGQQHEVREEDGEADRQVGVRVCLGPRGHCGLVHDHAQQKGAEDLRQQRTSCGEVLADHVGAQVAGVVPLTREDRGQEQGAQDAADGMHQCVHDALIPRQVPSKDEGESHRAIDLPSGEVADGVGEHQDAHAESEGHDETRLAIGRPVAASRAATHDHEEEHRQKLRDGRLHVDDFAKLPRRGVCVPAEGDRGSHA